MGLNQQNILETLVERDIDLLIVEELYCSDDFRKWFIQQLLDDSMAQEIGEFIEVLHSVRGGKKAGQTDIALRFAYKQNGLIFLIENKLGAQKMEAQAERYRARGNKYLIDNKCSAFITVLVAPEGYKKFEEGDFDKTIRYEAIAQWFVKKNDKRSLYKASIIEYGIKKKKRKSGVVEDETMRYFHDYYESLVDVYSENLKWSVRDVVPSDSSFIYFKNKPVDGFKLVDKLGIDRNEGHRVSIQLNKPDYSIEKEVVKIFTAEKGFVLSKTQKGTLMITKQLGTIYRDIPLNKQTEELVRGILVAQEMLDAFNEIKFLHTR